MHAVRGGAQHQVGRGAEGARCGAAPLARGGVPAGARSGLVEHKTGRVHSDARRRDESDIGKLPLCTDGIEGTRPRQELYRPAHAFLHFLSFTVLRIGEIGPQEKLSFCFLTKRLLISIC